MDEKKTGPSAETEDLVIGKLMNDVRRLKLIAIVLSISVLVLGVRLAGAIRLIGGLTEITQLLADNEDCIVRILSDFKEIVSVLYQNTGLIG